MNENKTMANITLPSQMEYPTPSSRRAMITRRENVFKNCDGTSSGITPQSLITFTIPPTNNLMVPQETYFTMRVQTLDAGARDDIQGNVQRLIQRLRILNTNGEILEDISNFNVLNEMLQKVYFNDDHLYDYLQPEGVYQKYGGTITGASSELGYAYDDYVGIDIPFNQAGCSLTDGVLTPGVGVFNTGLVSLGDTVSVRGTAINQGGTGTVIAVAAGTITLSNLAAAQNIAAANMRKITLIKQKSTYFQDGVKAQMAAGSGKLFSFQLRGSGILMMDKYLPLLHIGGLRIELTLESQTVGLVGGNDSYKINDPKIYYTLLTPSDQLAATLSKAARSGDLHFTYRTFNDRPYTITNGSDVNVEMTRPVFRLNNIFVVKRLVANVSSAVNDSFVFDNSNLFGNDGTADSYYQFIHNSIYYPVERVQSFERSYTELCKAIGHFGDLNNAVPFRKYKSPFADTRFVIAQSFETMHEADMFSGSSTKNNKSIIFNAKLSAADSSRYDFFIYYSRDINIQKTGGIVVSE